MAIRPDEIRNQTFAIVKRGYNRPDVHRYLGAIADELETFNRSASAEDEIVVADVIEVEPIVEDDPSAIETFEIDDGPKLEEPERIASVRHSSADDFDRVGNEISLMLRQAQESSIKIRNDAEVEARTLVDQVRLDIEADRLAHEQAAGELIARTEERAASVRLEAEDYAGQTRKAADEYSSVRRDEVDKEFAEAASAAEADRKLASDKLAAATEEADAMVNQATKRSDEIVGNAESNAQARSDELLSEARSTLATLIDAEQSSRSNLEQARSNIETALEQLRLTEIDATSNA